MARPGFKLQVAGPGAVCQCGAAAAAAALNNEHSGRCGLNDALLLLHRFVEHVRARPSLHGEGVELHLLLLQPLL
eukprot:CAMPEP_0181333612 /NCGR_PEP_ID=MMETSP1101-20121128/25775_1 /TAXON_ID=46948 /ORGANISM="Rhodomonas abbreviata, Strain Caron Lab Isolate" /LENGTH=74 /DNA_ID=CAMNT_0023443445 /DNA_START=202 /DNA_END=422 /DNA_ORIENTATION=-